MKFRFFTIPAQAAEDDSAELNQFLSAHRILAVDRQFVNSGPHSAWCICVGYDDGGTRPAPVKRGGKVDFRDILTDPEFAVFSRLRALRKTMADAEAIPAYSVLTNEQLLEVVRRRVTDMAGLRAISGIGDARLEKYGDAFLRIMTDAALPMAELAATA